MINPDSMSCFSKALILLLVHRTLFLNCVSTLSNDGPTNCYVVVLDANHRKHDDTAMHLRLLHSTCEYDPIVLHKKKRLAMRVS